LIFGRISRLIGPGNFELGNVLAMDLFQLRIEIAFFPPEIDRPIGILTVRYAETTTADNNQGDSANTISKEKPQVEQRASG
jgi:hypothetical protein